MGDIQRGGIGTEMVDMSGILHELKAEADYQKKSGLNYFDKFSNSFVEVEAVSYQSRKDWHGSNAGDSISIVEDEAVS